MKWYFEQLWIWEQIYLPTVCCSHPLLLHNHLHHLRGERSHPLHRLLILIHLSPLKKRKKEKQMKGNKNGRQYFEWPEPAPKIRGVPKSRVSDYRSRICLWKEHNLVDKIIKRTWQKTKCQSLSFMLPIHLVCQWKPSLF